MIYQTSAAEIYKTSLESYQAGFENGAASRDAEIAELTDNVRKECEEIFDDIFHPLSLDQETQEACSKFRTAIRADSAARRKK